MLSADMSDSYPLELSVEETKRLLDENPADVVLIDVREPSEFETCRIAGAELIPMRQIPEHLGSLPKDKHLLIHCHHGGRSLRVTQYLRANGYDAVSNVAGGIDAWSLVIDSAVPRY
jgi:rhodanese-related sulfurtransferase